MIWLRRIREHLVLMEALHFTAIRCWLGIHRWHYHNAVGDWFCEHCRKHKPDLGIRR